MTKHPVRALSTTSLPVSTFVRSLVLVLVLAQSSSAAPAPELQVGSGDSALPMNCALRTAGVAPLAVHFDAIGAVSAVMQPQSGQSPSVFHYAWDFGDPTSGKWFPTGKSKNRAVGFVATHVFEDPGVYSVRLQVTDPNGVTQAYDQDIHVFDPDLVYSGSTFYVSATTGNDAASGTSPATAFRTITHATSVLFAANGPARLLLKRGDVFEASSTIYAPTCVGPFTIAPYGTGARPVIECPHSGDGLAANFVQDLRVMDINLVGPLQGSTGAGFHLGGNSLALRTSLRGFSYGAGCFWGSGHDGNTVQECALVDNLTYGLYCVGVEHLSVLGCLFDNSVNNSLFRTYSSRTVAHANVFVRAALSPIRFMGRPLPNPTQYVVVTDNIVVSGSAWVLEIGPENSTSPQHIRHVLVEGNHFYGRGSQSTVLLFGEDMVVRSNVFDVGGAWSVTIQQRGIGPVPRGIAVDNNTAFRDGSGHLHFVSAATSDVTPVRNNIVHGGNGAPTLASGTVASFNNFTLDPLFNSPSSGDFRLQYGSAAIDGGLNGISFSDYDGRPRPFGGSTDIGAFER